MKPNKLSKSLVSFPIDCGILSAGRVCGYWRDTRSSSAVYALTTSASSAGPMMGKTDEQAVVTAQALHRLLLYYVHNL